jgi:hypothetical protein
MKIVRTRNKNLEKDLSVILAIPELEITLPDSAAIF